ncbi:MAG: Smr/MutS family protein [Gammaproteobacteria bacterium]|nr:Smr/MutS family protein [Gammaproteobacteria bacterium]NNL44642.1 DNA mismatch repair protein MutS [Woeseiaceae bacterium]
MATRSLYSMFSVHHSLEDLTLNDEDIDEFRRAISDAKPLKSEQRIPEMRPKPKPRARFSKADEREVLNESLQDDIDTIEHGYGAALRFHRASVGRRTMRKLARGGYSVQDEIDLHGMTVDEAKLRLADFIDYSVMRGNLCVRVVHGKGLGSGERGPVLKNAVNRWLRKWDSVLAFVSTRQVDGGTGAIYVLLQQV